MRLAITADLHLGYQRFYEDSFIQASAVLQRAAKVAEAVIIAGDIFDARVPRLEVLGRAIELLKIGKPIYAIHGTHERRAEGALNPVQLLHQAGIVQNIDGQQVVHFSGNEKVAITGFGGVPDEYAKNELKERNFKPVEGAFNIFVFHQTFAGFLPVAGISLSDLPKDFDLYICGHIHTCHTKKIGNAHLIIPGSTIVTQLKKEEMGEKGFVLYDTRSRKAEFIPIPTRRFIFKEVVFSAADAVSVRNSCRTILNNVAKDCVGGTPIVKLVLSGRLKDGLKKENIDLSDIRHEFEKVMFLEIESLLEAEGFAERIERFRRAHFEKKSLRELGLEMLKAKFGKDAEQLFEQLSNEKQIDEFIKKNLEG